MTDVPAAIQELTQLDQWVAYGADKIPKGPTGARASSTDPSTWGTLAQAKYVKQVQGLRGVGFVFSDGDPYVGIDLDDAIDPITGELHGWALEIVRRFDSYTEVSPGGGGLHIWVRGRLPRPGARTLVEDCSVEVYQSGRYFTVTGKPLPGCRLSIEQRDGELDRWFAEMFASPARSSVPFDGMTWETPDAETWIPDALAVLSPNMEEPDWRKVAASIKAEIGDRGYGMWDLWSQGSDKYPGSQATWRKWQSIDETHWNISTLVWMAGQYGFTPPTGRAVVPDWVSRGVEELWGNPVADADGATEGLTLQLFDVLDLIDDDSPYEPDVVGPGVLGAGDLMLVFGPPKSMKSLAVTSMAMDWALGREWMGMRPERPLRTLIAQFEVKRDNLRKRVKMLAGHYTAEERRQLAEHVFITDRFTPRLNVDFIEEFAELAHQATDHNFDLLVLDPLSNIYTGESENDNTQMAAFLRAVKVLRNQINPDLAVIMVHHANKVVRTERSIEPFNAIRGASSLRGAYDTGMYLDRVDEKSGKLMAFWELRNGPGLKPITLQFRNGRFEEVGDEIRYQVQQLLLEAADADVAFTKSNFVKTHAEQLGMHQAQLGALVAEMLADGELVIWAPDAQHEVKLSRAKGFIGVPGMCFKRFPITPIEG